MRVTRDIDLAQECAQDAYARALTAWPEAGIPAHPGRWLTTVARRRALDLLRRESALRRTLPLLVADEPDPGPEEAAMDSDRIPDDRLRLICTCCHPALAPETQIALTLRLVCGLTTAEVARAFLVSESTMAARLTRGKHKIAAAGIPYRVPPVEELPERLEAVLAVVHLLFTTGHTAPAGSDLVRRDLLDRALGLARMLRVLVPRDPAVAGLLALLLLTDARRATRVDAAGRLLLLEEQDRSRWDRDQIADGVELVREALRQRPPSRFALQAAIAALHDGAPTWAETDWPQIVGFYDRLARAWPSPVVSLNRAVAVGMAYGPVAGLAAIDVIRAEPSLAGYGYLAAARGAFLRRQGDLPAARVAYADALAVTDNEVERAFLRERLRELP